MTIGDVYAGLNALQTGTSARGTPFKQNTKHDYIVVLKSFVLWLIENGYSTIPAGEGPRHPRAGTSITIRPRPRRC